MLVGNHIIGPIPLLFRTMIVDESTRVTHTQLESILAYSLKILQQPKIYRSLIGRVAEGP